ncbi:Cytochrome P450 4V2 [Araneus ventricosus]|uniref:Cytochrome P450 4V2 n=1 Tax=Araneus ventricosus TaxID=182803 RepID=A0A4Y2EKE7_ARAVE|nr:Cytochrome P450 4V2 [Araneus ventricosus]
MLLVLVLSIFIGIFSVVLRFSLWRNKCSQLMPGKKPRFFDILGDTKEFIVYDTWPDKYLWQMNFFDVLRRRTEEYGKQQLFCLWITYIPFVVIIKAKAVKELIEKKVSRKFFFYKWLEPAIGTGLLTSDASKWKQRRKLLTPCFHSDILRGFLPDFNEYSQKFVEFLQEETKKEFTYIETPVTLLTLDIICETMFGVKIGALGNDSSQFVKSFRRFTEIIILRVFKLWNWPNCIFKHSKDGKEMMRHLKIVHDFTRNIIQEKKKRYLSGQRDQDNRKRKALLDLLLDRHMEAGELSEEDIREEVDTFALANPNIEPLNEFKKFSMTSNVCVKHFNLSAISLTVLWRSHSIMVLISSEETSVGRQERWTSLREKSPE